MKKRLILILIVISTLILCCFTVNATTINLKLYNVTLHSDSKGTLLVGRSFDELYTKKCYYNLKNTEKSYTFNKKIITHAVHKDKIYVIYPSDLQVDIYYMAVIENDRRTDLFHFYTNTLYSSCTMIVGEDGYFYIFNKKKQIDIYSQSGELVHTTDTFEDMLNIGNKCYGIKYNEIQEISHNGIGKAYTIEHPYNLFNVSENYIAGLNGEIYKFGLDNIELIMKVELNKHINPCETQNYIVTVKNNALLAYDKNYRKLKSSYVLEKDIYNISCYNEIITVVYNDNSVEFYLVDNIFPLENHNNSKATENNKTNTVQYNTNNADSKVTYNDDIIVIEQGTTISKFRDSVSGVVEFPENTYGQLGTGDIVTINNKVHTIIIKGDITGEGNINSRDLDSLFNHLLGEELLKDEFTTACDLNNDYKISNADLVLLSQMIG